MHGPLILDMNKGYIDFIQYMCVYTYDKNICAFIVKYNRNTFTYIHIYMVRLETDRHLF